MRFKGKDTEINIKTKKPEFSEWRWIDLDEITKWVVDFKTDVYKNLKSEVKKIIFNQTLQNLKPQFFDLIYIVHDL